MDGENGIAIRAQQFFAQIIEGSPLSPSQLAEYNSLVEAHDSAAKVAERNCRKLCMGGQVWTPEFSKNRDMCLFWKSMCHRLLGNKVDSRYIQRLAAKAVVITLDQAEAGIASANKLCLAY